MFHSQVDQQATDGERRLGFSLGNGFKIRVRQRPLFRLNDVGLWRYGVLGQPVALVRTLYQASGPPVLWRIVLGKQKVPNSVDTNWSTIWREELISLCLHFFRALPFWQLSLWIQTSSLVVMLITTLQR